MIKYKCGDNMDKNVLCVIYFFPPMGGSGVQRSLKFIKYMPKHNVYPIVETVDKGHNFAYDESLMSEIPSCVKVYRSNSGEKLWLRNVVEKTSSILRNISSLRNSKSEENIDCNSNSSSESLTLKEKVFKFIELNVFVPDSKIRWYKHAIKSIDKIMNKEKVDYLFSSSYPYTVHLIALYAKKKYNIPWIADFRDPWVGNVFMTEGQSEQRKLKEAKMEEEVIEYADKIIMVTEPICEVYKNRYPKYKEKFITIPNGFDREDYIQVEPIKEDKFTICYSGILTEGQSPESLIKALEKITDDIIDFKDNLKIKFIGYILPEYKNMFLNSNLKHSFINMAYMPHSQCLKHMMGANLNLLILANKEESKGVFSGKVFDYIGVEKPILGIIPKNGIAAELINNNAIGKSFEHSDISGIYNFIKDNYFIWKNNQYICTNSQAKCREFDRENLTRKLVDEFLEL